MVIGHLYKTNGTSQQWKKMMVQKTTDLNLWLRNGSNPKSLETLHFSDDTFVFLKTLNLQSTFSLMETFGQAATVRLRETSCLQRVEVTWHHYKNLGWTHSQWNHVCSITCAKQLKLEYCNTKVKSSSYYKIKRSLQANVQDLAV